MNFLLMKYGFALTLIYWFLKFLWKRFKGNSSNPFKTNKVIHRPFEMDRKKRKLLLKKSFSPDLVPNDIDAIVVGSGIGGLVCAGLLSRSGKRVLVLEQHDRAGGCTHSFKSKGYEFDVGIHYVGNMEDKSMNRCLIDLLTDHQLEWVEVDESFDTVVFSKEGSPLESFTCIKGVKSLQNKLIAEFPSEEKAIIRFFQLLKSCIASSNIFTLSKVFPKFIFKMIVKLRLHKLFFANYEYVTRNTLKEVLDSLTDNDRLKAILSYSFGDYGSPPDSACFFMHAMLLNHLYRKGGFYPKGGASEIAYQMIPGIVRSGGAVLTQAYVEEILIENGSACGVRLKTPNGNSHKISSPIVISDAGIYNTYSKMIPSSTVAEYGLMKGMECVKPGISCFQIMVGLNGTKEELNLSKKNYWMFTSHNPGEDFNKYLSMSREDAANSSVPLLFISFPSTKDPTWESRFPNKSTCIIVTMSTLSWFEEWSKEKTKKHGPVYDSLKSTFINQAWKQVLEMFPHLEDKVDHIEAGSPLTHVHYFNSVHGEIYGIDHNSKRFCLENSMNLRPETPIHNLYLAGQDVFTCGFMGGAFGGVLAASKVLNRYLLLDWIGAVGELRKKKQI